MCPYNNKKLKFNLEIFLAMIKIHVDQRKGGKEKDLNVELFLNNDTFSCIKRIYVYKKTFIITK